MINKLAEQFSLGSSSADVQLNTVILNVANYSLRDKWHKTANVADLFQM